MSLLENLFYGTLLLQEYALTAGHCKGLASAIPFIDNSKFKNIFLDNCGMNGDEFANILSALDNQPTFK